MPNNNTCMSYIDMRIFIWDDGKLGYGSVLNRQQREQEKAEKAKGSRKLIASQASFT